jgi:glycosyltransferase involved in cell wall biosynthesis
VLKISAVILAHNEMGSVGDVVRCCKRYCDEVIVIDDGSTDETFLISRNAGAIVIRNEVNKGIVESTNIGLRLASGDIIVTLDADAQHDPSEIPSIVRPIAQDLADLVLGRRNNGRPVSERIISEIVSLRVKCHDAGTGFRAFRRELAHGIRLWGFCLCGSLVLEAQRQGARIVEVPIMIRPRRFGKSHWASPLSRGAIHCKQAFLLFCQLLRWTHSTNLRNKEETLPKES